MRRFSLATLLLATCFGSADERKIEYEGKTLSEAGFAKACRKAGYQELKSPKSELFGKAVEVRGTMLLPNEKHKNYALRINGKTKDQAYVVLVLSNPDKLPLPKIKGRAVVVGGILEDESHLKVILINEPEPTIAFQFELKQPNAVRVGKEQKYRLIGTITNNSKEAIDGTWGLELDICTPKYSRWHHIVAISLAGLAPGKTMSIDQPVMLYNESKDAATTHFTVLGKTARLDAIKEGKRKAKKAE